MTQGRGGERGMARTYYEPIQYFDLGWIGNVFKGIKLKTSQADGPFLRLLIQEI